ncbi:MAG: DUF2851 family protein [Verrucomicrobiales bacterium]|nr:DUF2851 family protein [Verrucomicrobiales bacterium]MCP5560796.1 DUF2851 family protein [Verrucomicrobiaceae bacterium]
MTLPSTPPLPLADRYERFRDSVFSGLEEPTRLPGFDEPLCELDLQSLWFCGSFGSEFKTEDGRTVKITDFGSWNAGAGPDFNGVSMLIDGQAVRGDVELDPDVRDWERHLHAGNPEYNKVVLHVFLSSPQNQKHFTRTSNHLDVPQVQLTAAMLAVDAAPKSRDAAARIGRCATPLRDMEPARITSMLESAAQFRLQAKSRRLYRIIAASGREQAIYQALAQTLGYLHNQRPFAILSQRLPLNRMLKEPTAQREALLFGVSGFLEMARPDDIQKDSRAYLRGLWSHWWKIRQSCSRWMEPQQMLRWKMTAIRPGNHPQRRLGALLAILANWEVVAPPLMDATRWSLAAWRDTVAGLKHDFWSSHYSLSADEAESPMALVGATRVHEMLANVVYPLLVPERTRLWAEYLELPALLDNQKVRKAITRLFGDHPDAANFRKLLFQHQGLLQIYEDFCLADDSACADCPFPERLKEW